MKYIVHVGICLSFALPVLATSLSTMRIPYTIESDRPQDTLSLIVQDGVTSFYRRRGESRGQALRRLKGQYPYPVPYQLPPVQNYSYPQIYRQPVQPTFYQEQPQPSVVLQPMREEPKKTKDKRRRWTGAFKDLNCPMRYDGIADIDTVSLGAFQFPIDEKGKRTHRVYYRWTRVPGLPVIEYWPYLSDKARDERDKKMLEKLAHYRDEFRKKYATLIEEYDMHWNHQFEQYEKSQKDWHQSALKALEDKLKNEFPGRTVPNELRSQLQSVLKAHLTTRQALLIDLKKNIKKYRQSIVQLSNKAESLYQKNEERFKFVSYHETNVTRDKEYKFINVFATEAKKIIEKKYALPQEKATSFNEAEEMKYLAQAQKIKEGFDFDTKYIALVKTFRFTEARKARFAITTKEFEEKHNTNFQNFEKKHQWVKSASRAHEDWYKNQVAVIEKKLKRDFADGTNDHVKRSLMQDFKKGLEHGKAFGRELNEQFLEETNRRNKFKTQVLDKYSSIYNDSSATLEVAMESITKLEKEESSRRTAWEAAFSKNAVTNSAKWTEKWGKLDETKITEQKYALLIAGFPLLKVHKQRKYRLRIEKNLTRTVDYVDRFSTDNKIGKKLFSFGTVTMRDGTYQTLGLNGFAIIDDTAVFLVESLTILDKKIVDKSITDETLTAASKPSGKSTSWLAVFQEGKLKKLIQPPQDTLSFHQVRVVDESIEVTYLQGKQRVTKFAYRILPNLKSFVSENSNLPFSRDPFEDVQASTQPIAK